MRRENDERDLAQGFKPLDKPASQATAEETEFYWAQFETRQRPLGGAAKPYRHSLPEGPGTGAANNPPIADEPEIKPETAQEAEPAPEDCEQTILDAG